MEQKNVTTLHFENLADFKRGLEEIVARQKFYEVDFKVTFLDDRGATPEVLSLLPHSARVQREFYGLANDGTDKAAAVRNASETGLVFGLNDENGNPKIVAVSQCALDRSFPERSETRGNTPKRHPAMYNIGIHENNGSGIVYLKDDVLMAYHSNGYGVFYQDKLLDTLLDGLEYADKNYQFIDAFYHDELTVAHFELPSLKKELERIGIDGYMPGVVFQTSDVTASGVNLIGYLKRERDGLRARMGSTLSVKHVKSKDITDFALNVDKISSLLKDSADRLNDLKKIKIRNPEQCFANICKSKDYHFPVTEWKEAYDDFCAQRGIEVTAFDLYWSLWRIPDNMKRNNMDDVKIVSVQEDITRVMFAKWERFDVDYAI